MTNNENDDDLTATNLGVDDIDDTESFDDFEGGEGSKMSSPLVKVGIVVAAVATIIGAIMLFGGEEESKTQSRVREARDVSAQPGMDEVSAEMQRALEQKNEEVAEQAARTGTSAMPVPITPPQQVLELPEMGAGAEEDPLEKWRKIQEERQKREAMQARPTTQQGDPNAQIVDKLAKSMSQQMQTILDAQAILPPQTEVVTPMDWLEKKAKEREEKLEKAKAAAASNQTPGNVVLDILQPAGTIEYAQLITEANSDVPGPVLAQIMSGPLVGSRVLGTFKVQDDYLVLTFNTIVVDGVSYSADVIALDPSTANPGLVTELDRRYFRRVILPAAAAFIEGLGSAIAESGTTSVSVSGDTVVQADEELDTRQEIFKGVEEGASKISEILDQDASKVKPLVRVHAGAAIGVLFLQPVTKEQGKM